MTEHGRRRFWVLAGLTALVLAVAYGPLLVEFFAKQWERPHYQYFPFVIGAFVWLLWQRLRQAQPREEGLEAGGWGRGAKELSAVAEEWSGGGAAEARHPHSGPLPMGEGSGAEEGQRAANRYGVIIALIAAWGLLGLAYVANSPWLAYLSLICLVTSVFLQLSSNWQVPYLWGVWLLLWLVVPLPMNRDQQLISFLQQQSSRLSSFVLDWVGVVHLMEGNTLILPDKQFFVDEACSGIVSVMSIIACAVIYGVWRNRPPLHLVVLAAAGIGWATLMNVARISAIAIAYQWYGVDWSKGTPHEVLGLAVFLCTFLALVSTDYALLVLLSPIRALYVQQYGDPLKFGAWLSVAWDWLQGWGRPMAYAVASYEERGASAAGARSEEQGVSKLLAVGARPLAGVVEEQKSEGEESTSHPSPLPTGDGTFGFHPGPVLEGEGTGWEIARRFVLAAIPLLAFGVIASAQFVVPIWFPNRIGEAPHNIERALALGESALPKDLGEASLFAFTPQTRSRDDVFGNFSRIYEYQDGRGSKYLVSCDFPLEPDGHELTLCYQGIGWQLMGRELTGEREASVKTPEETWGFVEADYKKPDGSAAFLVFCSFDEHGTRVTPRSGSLWGDIRRTLQKQIRAASPERTYQVQVWTIAPGTVHEEQKEVARELLLNVRERFRELVTGGTVLTSSTQAGSTSASSVQAKSGGVESLEPSVESQKVESKEE